MNHFISIQAAAGEYGISTRWIWKSIRVDRTLGAVVRNGRVYLPPTSQSVEAAKRALDGENVVGSALYFYAPALSQGTWINANRPYQQTIGCHRFYR